MVTGGVPLHARVAEVAQSTPGLLLLLLFGSRARGDARVASDWDFGYLAGPAFEPDTLLAALVEALGTDRVDLVHLGTSSGLLRFRAARDGVALFEAHQRIAERFRLDVATYWCDAAAVIHRGYEHRLAALTP